MDKDGDITSFFSSENMWQRGRLCLPW